MLIPKKLWSLPARQCFFCFLVNSFCVLLYFLSGVSEEKVKSAGPSPASSVSSIASNPRSTSSPRHAPTVRKVPIEDRRTASTASPATRRTKAGTSTTNTTTKARSTTSTIASRSRTTGTAGGRMGTTKQVNHMTPVS